MLKMNSYSMNATSMIDESIVSYLSVSMSTDGDGNVNIGNNIVNYKIYNENKEQCKQDYDEFETKANETYNSLKN